MENQREHGKKDAAEKMSEEIAVNSLVELSVDDELRFEILIVTKTRNLPIEHFTFYESLTGRKNDFKHRIQMYLQKELKMGIATLNMIIVETLPYTQSREEREGL